MLTMQKLEEVNSLFQMQCLQLTDIIKCLQTNPHIIRKFLHCFMLTLHEIIGWNTLVNYVANFEFVILSCVNEL